MSNLWAKLVGNADDQRDIEDEVLGQARSYLEWAEKPYHKRFLDYLQAESDKPVDMRDTTSMIAGTASSNTFKKIRAYLRELDKRARIALGEE